MPTFTFHITYCYVLTYGKDMGTNMGWLTIVDTSTMTLIGI
jgi:hypothetical protein